MLTPEEWKIVGKQANYLYNQLELEIIQEIAERIANVGYANTVVLNDALIAQEMGLLYQDIIGLVAKYNNTTEEQIRSIFENAGIQSLEYDDNIYKLQGLKPIPLKQSESMWQLLTATAIKTHNSNITTPIISFFSFNSSVPGNPEKYNRIVVPNNIIPIANAIPLLNLLISFS